MSTVLPLEFCTGLGDANPPARQKVLFSLAGDINVGLCPVCGFAVSVLHFVLTLSLTI